MPTTYTARTRVQVIITSDVYEVSTPASGATSVSGPIESHPVFAYDETFQSGTGSLQMDRVAKKAVNLAAAAQDLDVSGATFTTPGGTAWTLAKLKLVALKNTSQTTANKILALGDANSVPILNTAATTANVGPRGLLLWVSPIDGVTVTAGTGDIIQLDPASNTIDGEIMVGGTSA